MIINHILLDELLKEAAASPRLRMNRDLRNSADDQSHRMLNALLPGTQVPIHRHRNTSETVILLKGKIDEIYYNDEVVETERFHLGIDGTYGINIPIGQWHSIAVFEPSVILEVKDGKYIPAGPEDIVSKPI